MSSGDSVEVKVAVVVREGDERHLDTETGSQLEELAELHLILSIDGSLCVVEGREDLLCGIVKVGMRDHEERRTSTFHTIHVIHEGLP